MRKTTKLICINASYWIHDLSETGIYEGEADTSGTDEGWYIRFEDDRWFWYPKRCFMPLSEWRDKQIDSILEN
jgi:hypothetical protein